MSVAAQLFESHEIDNEVAEAIAVCGGDAVAALRATLIANAFLEQELARITAMLSAGYGRGQDRKPAPREKIRVRRIKVED
jgi:hypothetical protein